jgi:hypothetical protein
VAGAATSWERPRLACLLRTLQFDKLTTNGI